MRFFIFQLLGCIVEEFRKQFTCHSTRLNNMVYHEGVGSGRRSGGGGGARRQPWWRLMRLGPLNYINPGASHLKLGKWPSIWLFFFLFDHMPDGMLYPHDASARACRCPYVVSTLIYTYCMVQISFF